MIFRKVVHSFAPRSIAASSRWRSNPISRAFTVTTMKLTMNMTWAMKIVQKPSVKTLVVFRKSVRSEAPSTISGVDIGRNTRMFVGSAAAEVVPHDGERHERAEHGCDERGEQADLDRLDQGLAQPEHRVPLDPVVERELLPDVVEATGGLVEREQDDDRDRKHQVGHDEDRVHGEQMSLDESHQPVELLRPDELRVEEEPTRMNAMRTNESDAAVG